jgi:hypothetical protein
MTRLFSILTTFSPAKTKTTNETFGASLRRKQKETFIRGYGRWKTRCESSLLPASSTLEYVLQYIYRQSFFKM